MAEWTLDPDEIVPGLVVHLDPRTLLGEGARTSASRSQRASSFHYFVCLAPYRDGWLWMPLSSKEVPGERLPLYPRDKTGLATFVRGVSHVVATQVWWFTLPMLAHAAEVGHDHSTPRCRNHVPPGKLPPLPDWRPDGGG
jgi:hypothetical protein